MADETTSDRPELGALQITVTPGAAETLVALSGELDQSQFPRADAALQKALAAQPERLVIDMRALWFVDSAGIRALLRAYHQARQQGSRFAIRAGEGGSRQVLKLAGLESLVEADPA
jgi:anti-sigma B factor antagonist